MIENEHVEAPEKKYVHKGWGYEEWLCNNDLYCGKRLHFWKGKRCSFHYHEKKDETFWVTSGKFEVRYSMEDCIKDGKFNIKLAERIVLEVGDTFHIVPGMRHSMFALEEGDLVEFSTRHYEDDSYRVKKGD